VSTLTDLACYDDDNEIRIFDSTGDITNDDNALYWDDQDGDSSCAYIGPLDSADDDVTDDVADPTRGMLPAGTYTVKINDYFGDAETRYLFGPSQNRRGMEDFVADPARSDRSPSRSVRPAACPRSRRGRSSLGA
jgi:hypothetical protein